MTLTFPQAQSVMFYVQRLDNGSYVTKDGKVVSSHRPTEGVRYNLGGADFYFDSYEVEIVAGLISGWEFWEFLTAN